MARNPKRRSDLLDAAISVLANQGARGLTHRAVDARAGVPIGTTSNYFSTHSEIVAGIFRRISERLEPDPVVQEELGRLPPSRDVFRAYLRAVVERLMANRDVALALFELRLESTRHPEVAGQLLEWRQTGFQADVAFNNAADLPGDRTEIALIHYAIDGLLLDRLTVSIDPDVDPTDVADILVDRLFHG